MTRKLILEWFDGEVEKMKEKEKGVKKGIE